MLVGTRPPFEPGARYQLFPTGRYENHSRSCCRAGQDDFESSLLVSHWAKALAASVSCSTTSVLSAVAGCGAGVSRFAFQLAYQLAVELANKRLVV